MFDIVSFSDTDKGILLFSIQDRQECDQLIKSLYSEAERFGNCFHEYILNNSLNTSHNSPNVCECDSMSPI